MGCLREDVSNETVSLAGKGRGHDGRRRRAGAHADSSSADGVPQVDPFPRHHNARLEGQESIDGAPCDKVSIAVPHDKKTFWVDTKTFLLRRYSRERDQIDMKKDAEAKGRTLPADMEAPESFSMTSVHDFTINSAS